MKKIRDGVFEIEKEGDMNTPARIYATEKLVKNVEEGAINQLKNVAMLPGIQKNALAMADMHYGYGFPIGGVAAFDLETGIISPGGVGFDINCGVRLLKTNLTKKDVNIKSLIDKMFDNVPSGVGSKGKLRLNNDTLSDAVTRGVDWAIEEGYGFEKDRLSIEENGHMKNADPSKISKSAFKRGLPQLGTLGAGNHFLEIQEIEEIYDQKMAEKLGLEKGNLTVMIHTGSRGFGHQVASDYIKVMMDATKKYNIKINDRQLCSAPIKSEEGQAYLQAMNCGINYAFNNRQLITHFVRESFEQVLGKDPENLGMDIVYDVCHNIAKLEKHEVNGQTKELMVHRKGATRAFVAEREEVPEIYRHTGQPAIIPGDMRTASYVVVGTEVGMNETFGTVPHGAGRCLSRHEAMRQKRGEEVKAELEKQGEYVKAKSWKTLAEEMPDAYKNINDVIDAIETSGIGKKVVKLKPIGVMKGWLVNTV